MSGESEIDVLVRPLDNAVEPTVTGAIESINSTVSNSTFVESLSAADPETYLNTTTVVISAIVVQTGEPPTTDPSDTSDTDIVVYVFAGLIGVASIVAAFAVYSKLTSKPLKNTKVYPKKIEYKRIDPELQKMAYK